MAEQIADIENIETPVALADSQGLSENAEQKQLYTQDGDHPIYPLSLVDGLIYKVPSATGGTTMSTGTDAITDAIRYGYSGTETERVGGPMDVSVGKFSASIHDGNNRQQINSVVVDDTGVQVESTRLSFTGDSSVYAVWNTFDASISSSVKLSKKEGANATMSIDMTSIDTSVYTYTLKAPASVSVKTDNFAINSNSSNAIVTAKRDASNNNRILVTVGRDTSVTGAMSVTGVFEANGKQIVSNGSGTTIKTASGDSSLVISSANLSYKGKGTSGEASLYAGATSGSGLCASTNTNIAGVDAKDGKLTLHTNTSNNGTADVSIITASSTNNETAKVILSAAGSGTGAGTSRITVSAFKSGATVNHKSTVLVDSSITTIKSINYVDGNTAMMRDLDPNSATQYLDFRKSPSIGLHVGQGPEYGSATLAFSRQAIQAFYGNGTDKNKVTGLYLQPRGGSVVIGSADASRRSDTTFTVNGSTTLAGSLATNGNVTIHDTVVLTKSGESDYKHNGVVVSANDGNCGNIKIWGGTGTSQRYGGYIDFHKYNTPDASYGARIIYDASLSRLQVSGATLDATSNLIVGGTSTLAGNVAITSTTSSTSKTTGALKVSGGAGISGNLNVGSATVLDGSLVVRGGRGNTGEDTWAFMVNNATASIDAIGFRGRSNSNTAVAINGYGSKVQALYVDASKATYAITAAGKVNITSTASTTSTSTGALTVSGGVGVGGGLQVAGPAVFRNTGTSSASTNGAVQVKGGLGVVGKLNIGGGLNVESGGVVIGNGDKTNGQISCGSTGSYSEASVTAMLKFKSSDNKIDAGTTSTYAPIWYAKDTDSNPWSFGMLSQTNDSHLAIIRHNSKSPQTTDMYWKFNKDGKTVLPGHVTTNGGSLCLENTNEINVYNTSTLYLNYRGGGTGVTVGKNDHNSNLYVYGPVTSTKYLNGPASGWTAYTNHNTVIGTFWNTWASGDIDQTKTLTLDMSTLGYPNIIYLRGSMDVNHTCTCKVVLKNCPPTGYMPVFFDLYADSRNDYDSIGFEVFTEDGTRIINVYSSGKGHVEYKGIWWLSKTSYYTSWVIKHEYD